MSPNSDARSPSPGARLRQTLEQIANDALKAWDADQDARVGKILAALAGRLPGYRADVDLLRAQLAAPGETQHESRSPDGDGQSSVDRAVSSEGQAHVTPISPQAGDRRSTVQSDQQPVGVQGHGGKPQTVNAGGRVTEQYEPQPRRPRRTTAGFESLPTLTNNKEHATETNDPTDVRQVLGAVPCDGLRSEARPGDDVRGIVRQRQEAADAGRMEGASSDKEADDLSSARPSERGSGAGDQARVASARAMPDMRRGEDAGPSRGLRETAGGSLALPDASQGERQGTWSDGQLISEPADSQPLSAVADRARLSPAERELKIASLLVRETDSGSVFLKDHACAQCVPGVFIPEHLLGFVCGYHEALAVIASASALAPPDDRGRMTKPRLTLDHRCGHGILKTEPCRFCAEAITIRCRPTYAHPAAPITGTDDVPVPPVSEDEKTVVAFYIRPVMTADRWRPLLDAAGRAGAFYVHVNPPELAQADGVGVRRGSDDHSTDVAPGQLIVDLRYGSRHHHIEGEMGLHPERVETILRAVHEALDQPEALAEPCNTTSNPNWCVAHNCYAYHCQQARNEPEALAPPETREDERTQHMDTPLKAAKQKTRAMIAEAEMVLRILDRVVPAAPSPAVPLTPSPTGASSATTVLSAAHEQARALLQAAVVREDTP